MVDGSFYSVPHTLVGSEVEVHVHERVVELYARSRAGAHAPPGNSEGSMADGMEDYPPAKAQPTCEPRRISVSSWPCESGPHTHQVVEHLLADRPLDRLRSVQAILALAESVGEQAPGSGL